MFFNIKFITSTIIFFEMKDVEQYLYYLEVSNTFQCIHSHSFLGWKKITQQETLAFKCRSIAQVHDILFYLFRIIYISLIL